MTKMKKIMAVASITESIRELVLQALMIESEPRGPHAAA